MTDYLRTLVQRSRAEAATLRPVSEPVFAPRPNWVDQATHDEEAVPRVGMRRRVRSAAGAPVPLESLSARLGEAPTVWAPPASPRLSGNLGVATHSTPTPPQPTAGAQMTDDLEVPAGPEPVSLPQDRAEMASDAEPDRVAPEPRHTSHDVGHLTATSEDRTSVPQSAVVHTTTDSLPHPPRRNEGGVAPASEPPTAAGSAGEPVSHAAAVPALDEEPAAHVVDRAPESQIMLVPVDMPSAPANAVRSPGPWRVPGMDQYVIQEGDTSGDQPSAGDGAEGSSLLRHVPEDERDSRESTGAVERAPSLVRSLPSTRTTIGAVPVTEAAPNQSDDVRSDGSPPTIIHVSIGRIEVRAVPPATPAAAARQVPPRPQLPLEEYLRRRNSRETT